MSASKFAQTFKVLRVAKGFNQAQVGQVFGVARETINSWENARTQPSCRDIILDALASMKASPRQRWERSKP